MQQPNYDLDGPPPAAVSIDAPSLDAFARDANVFLRELRAAYFESLQRGDDAGVLATTRHARVVEHAVCAHASARSLSAIRSRAHAHAQPHAHAEAPAPRGDAEVAAQKAYLRGVQARLEDALSRRDVDALRHIAAGADAAMEHLAHSDAFADLAPRVQLARQLENRAVVVDRELAASAKSHPGGNESSDERFLRSMQSTTDDDELFPESNQKRRRPFAGFSFKRLSRKDKIVFLVYLLMLLFAGLAVVFITIEFIGGIQNPESFIRLNPQDSLPMPVVTVCLSRAGMPLSRLQLFNFTDAKGRHYRGSSPTGGLKPKDSAAIDRYYYNPNNEDCEAKLGDFFPFNVDKMNALANGTMVTSCQPCFKFGHKIPVQTNSTKFEHSSFASIFTDNYALECFKEAGGLTAESEEFLHEFMHDNLLKPEPDNKIGKVLRETIIFRDGQSNANFTLEELKLLKSKELCNIFYFGVFPKNLNKIPRNDSQVKYTLKNNKWVFEGTGPEFIPPRELRKDEISTDFFPLEAVRVFVSRSDANISVIEDNVLIGPNTQSFISLTSVKDSDKNFRYDMSTSTSNFVDSEVRPLFGYWFNYRLFYNYGRLIEEEYYSGSPYTFLQWLIDFTGYLSLFTGASVFSVILVPILLAMRNNDRKTLRKENPEAYLLRKYRRNFGTQRAVDTDEYAVGTARGGGEEGRSITLPGYTV